MNSTAAGVTKRSRGEVRFDPASPNDLRRTSASYLCNGGTDLFTASRLMGHASITMIQHTYAQLSAKTLAAGIEKAASYLVASSTGGSTALCASPDLDESDAA